MRADLHLHSLCSDGVFPPAEVARRVKEAGVQMFSLTDHDNMAGAEEAARAARELSLHFVRGIEISAYLGGAKVHMLGYGCKENGAYFAFLEERRKGAQVRVADAVKKANAVLGLDVTMDEVEGYHVRKEAPLHAMHAVQAFAERLNADMGAMYRDLFAPGKAAFSDMCRPSPADALRCIHDMGGLAVLAHPAQIFLPSGTAGRTALMEELAGLGLDGIECYHTTHTAKETEEFLAFAEGHGLIVTGGSDYHADGRMRTLGKPFFDAVNIEKLLLSLAGSI